MKTADLTIALGRSPLWVSKTRKRFGLPLMEDYPDTALTFLLKVRDLGNLGVSEDRVARLWDLERTLIRQLNLATGDDFLSLIVGCAAGADPERRLLLSNADLGVPLLARDLQPGLDFSDGRPRELFEGKDMGEDALRLLLEYQILLQEVMGIFESESNVLKDSLKWAKSVGLKPRK